MIIDFYQKREEINKKELDEMQQYKIWLPLPILIPKEFKDGDILVRIFTQDNSYEYFIPNEAVIEGINKNYKNGHLEKKMQWCLMKTVENLIYDYENNKTIS